VELRVLNCIDCIQCSSGHGIVDIADNVSDSGYDHRKIKKAKRTDEEKKKRKKEKRKKKEKEKEDKVVFSQ